MWAVSALRPSFENQELLYRYLDRAPGLVLPCVAG